MKNLLHISMMGKVDCREARRKRVEEVRTAKRSFTRIKTKKSFSQENDFFIGVIWIIAQIKA